MALLNQRAKKRRRGAAAEGDDVDASENPVGVRRSSWAVSLAIAPLE